MLFYISGTGRLSKPVLDLDITKANPLLSFTFVAALPGGEAIVNSYNISKKRYGILKMNSNGSVKQIFQCKNCDITGLLILGDYLYMTYVNGTVMQCRVSDGQLLKVSTIPDVGSIINTGSLYSNPDKIPDKDTLLLCDDNKGEVLTFKPSNGQKKVRITGLSYPRSVSYLFYNATTYYVVCVEVDHKINTYNSTWNLVKSIRIGGIGFRDEGFPRAAVVSDENTIIVSHRNNHRVSEFSFDGRFLHDLLDKYDVYWPSTMSYSFPYLWLVDDGLTPNNCYRYSLYGKSIIYILLF